MVAGRMLRAEDEVSAGCRLLGKVVGWRTGFLGAVHAMFSRAIGTCTWEPITLATRIAHGVGNCG